MSHNCPECGYVVDRDIAAAQQICNRGMESTQGRWGGKGGIISTDNCWVPKDNLKSPLSGETACQLRQQRRSLVEVSGAISLDNWRRAPNN